MRPRVFRCIWIGDDGLVALQAFLGVDKAGFAFALLAKADDPIARRQNTVVEISKPPLPGLRIANMGGSAFGYFCRAVLESLGESPVVRVAVEISFEVG